jgi:DNA-binding MarR family transcriptional regulator
VVTAAKADRLWSFWDAFVRAQAVALPLVHKRLYERHGLTLSEFTVLQHVATTVPATMTELQRSTAMSASGITRVVASLASQGLVSAVQSSRDRRLRHVTTTASGRRLLGAARSTAETELLSLLPQNLGNQQIALLTGFLNDLGSPAA